jgi:hypothetical protein
MQKGRKMNSLKHFDLLSINKNEKCNEIIDLLKNNNLVSGVLLGGSISYKKDIEKSDVDLFCLINQVQQFENDLKINLNIPSIDVIIHQGSFPWTGKLYTIYFIDEIDFSIDICLIDLKSVKTFFWEPNGIILFDKEGIIEKSRNFQMSKPDFTYQPFLKSNPFSLAVITLKKIDKNLSRGHIWNALEQLNILRRYIMQIIRLQVVKHNYFLGRVDRDFEDVIPNDINLQLSKTTATYNPNDIALKTIMLIEILEKLTDYLLVSNEEYLQEWIFRQLVHEKNKLKFYIINA